MRYGHATEVAIKPAEYDMREQYLRFNQLAFDGRLPIDLPLEFANTRTQKAMGLFKFYPTKDGSPVDPNRASIVLDTGYDYTKGGYDGVLLHEMVHAYVILVLGNQSMELGGHHKQFQEELDRVDNIVRSMGIEMPASESADIMEFATGVSRKKNFMIGVIKRQGEHIEDFLRFVITQPSVFDEIVNNFEFKMTTRVVPLKNKALVPKGMKTVKTRLWAGANYYNDAEGNWLTSGRAETVELYKVSDGELALLLSKMNIASSQVLQGTLYKVAGTKEAANSVLTIDGRTPSIRPDLYAALQRAMRHATNKAEVKIDGVWQGNNLIHPRPLPVGAPAPEATPSPVISPAKMPATYLTTKYGAIFSAKLDRPEGFRDAVEPTFLGLVLNQKEGRLVEGDHSHEFLTGDDVILYVYMGDALAWNRRQVVHELFNRLPENGRVGGIGWQAAEDALRAVTDDTWGIYDQDRVTRLFGAVESALGMPAGAILNAMYGGVSTALPSNIFVWMTAAIKIGATQQAIERVYKAIAGSPGTTLSNDIRFPNLINASTLVQELFASRSSMNGDGVKMWDGVGIYLSKMLRLQPWADAVTKFMQPAPLFRKFASKRGDDYFNTLISQLQSLDNRNIETSLLVDIALAMADRSKGEGGGAAYEAHSERYIDTLDALRANQKDHGGILSKYRVRMVESALQAIIEAKAPQSSMAQDALVLLTTGEMDKLIGETNIRFPQLFEELVHSTGWLITMFNNASDALLLANGPTSDQYRRFTIAMYILADCETQLPTAYRRDAWDMWDIIQDTASAGPRSVIPEFKLTTLDEVVDPPTLHRDYARKSYDEMNVVERKSVLVDAGHTDSEIRDFDVNKTLDQQPMYVRQAFGGWTWWGMNGYNKPTTARVKELQEGLTRSDTHKYWEKLVTTWKPGDTIPANQFGSDSDWGTYETWETRLKNRYTRELAHVNSYIRQVDRYFNFPYVEPAPTPVVEEVEPVVEPTPVVPAPVEAPPEPPQTHIDPKSGTDKKAPERDVVAPKVKTADGKTNWNITIGVNEKTKKLMFVPKDKAESNNIALVRKRDAKAIALFLSWVFHEDLLAITAKIKSGQRKQGARDLAKIANQIRPYILAAAKEQTPFPGKLGPKVETEFGEGLPGQKKYMLYLQGRANSRLKLWKDIDRLKDLSGILGADVDDEETASSGFDIAPWQEIAKGLPDLELTDELLATAIADTKAAARSSPFVSDAIEHDQQGIMPGKLRVLDTLLSSGKVEWKDAAAPWTKTRQLIRRQHGNVVVLYRANAPVEDHGAEPITVFMGTKALAKKFAHGRTLLKVPVKVSDILAINARRSGYFEVIVKFSALAKATKEQD